MKPVTWVFLVIITIVFLVVVDQIPLVQDTITATGFSATEVIAGIGSVLMTFYIVLAIFEVR